MIRLEPLLPHLRLLPGLSPRFGNVVMRDTPELWVRLRAPR